MKIRLAKKIMKPSFRNGKIKTVQRMNEEKCCGNCIWFDNEDVYGVGWCSNNEHESSCDLVCDEHKKRYNYE